MSLPAREDFPFMPSWTPEALYLALAVSAVVFMIGAIYKVRYYEVGIRELTSALKSSLTREWGNVFRDHVAQRRVIERRVPGLAHLSIYSGTIVLFIGTSLVFLDLDILRFFGIRVLQGGFYLGYETVLDLFGLIFIFGFALAFLRRIILRPRELKIRWDDVTILSGLIFVGVSGFFLEGMRLAMNPIPWASASFIGFSVAGFLGSSNPTMLLPAYQLLWWGHALIVFSLIAILPFSKLGHIFGSWANYLLQKGKAMGKLSTPFKLQELMESGSFDVKVGLTTPSDLDWKSRLSLDTCVDCGRCQQVCPAHASGRDLSPRLLVQDLSKAAHSQHSKRESQSFFTEAVREDEVWSCVGCNACVGACPVSINQLDFITDLRRGLVADNKVDEKKKAFLAGIDQSYNPFGLPVSERADWLLSSGVPTVVEAPEAQYLYWVGCQSSYDTRCRKVVKAMMSIMTHAGISFAILGRDEKCSGEPVRRLGEEGRFQQLATENIETLKKHHVKKIVTHCAHCFNTFKNEYPEFGADFEVIHHSELIWQLLKEGRITPKQNSSSKITYHDPCNLGRVNQVYDPPRKVLEAMTSEKPSEMGLCKGDAFCCGGGGANPWYTVPEKVKISQIRLEHAKATTADTLAVACPFCLSMFEDANSGKEGSIKRTMDIAEVVQESLEIG